MKKPLIAIALFFVMFFTIGTISNNPAFFRMYGWASTQWQKVNLDKSTNATITISNPHHEIHDGRHYHISKYAVLGDGDSLIFAVHQTDTTRWAHMLFDVTSTAILYIYNFEGGSFSGGDTLSPINNNRNSANTSILTIAEDPAAYTIGSVFLDSVCIGAAIGPGSQTDVGGDAGRDDELILAQDSVYFWYFVSGAVDNVVNVKGLWYEHIDKN